MWWKSWVDDGEYQVVKKNSAHHMSTCHPSIGVHTIDFLLLFEALFKFPVKNFFDLAIRIPASQSTPPAQKQHASKMHTRHGCSVGVVYK